MVDFRDSILPLAGWYEGKALIMYGAGDDFSAGIDPFFAASNPTTYAAHDISFWMCDALLHLRYLPFLTVCVLSGLTAGLASEIPLYFDYILMEKNATIRFDHSAMGITPAWGGCFW